MKYLLVLLCICTISACELVETNNKNFETLVGPGVFNEFRKGFQVADGGYVAAGYSVRNDDPNLLELPYKCYIVRFDQYGNLEQELELQLSNFDEIATGIRLNNGDLLFAGHSRSRNNDQDNLLIRVTPQGDTVWCKVFGTLVDEEIVDLAEDFDGHIIALVASGTPAVFTTEDSRLAQLVRISGDGTIIDQNMIPDSVSIAAIGDLELLTEQTYLLSGRQNDSLGSVPAVWLYTRDTIRSLYRFNGKGTAGKLLSLASDSFLLVGNVEDTLQHLWYFNLDGQITAVKQRVDLGTELADVERYFSGNYVIAWNKTDKRSAFFNVSLNCYNAAKQSIWEQWFTAPNTIMVHDIEVTGDSGFVMTGFKDVEGEGSKALMLKVDKHGLLQ